MKKRKEPEEGEKKGMRKCERCKNLCEEKDKKRRTHVTV